MIGTRISARRPSPKGALVLLGIGAAVAGLGMATRVAALVPLAFAPLAVGASLLVVGERGFRARFTPTAMEVARPPQVIPYATLIEVRPLVPAGRPRADSFPIQLVHTRGGLVIPARLNLSSERVYFFLRGFIADRRPALPAPLEAYRAEQEAGFGKEKVWSYVGRCGGDRPRVRNLRAIAAGFLATGTLWAAIPLRRADEPFWWVAAGVMALLGGGLLAQDVHLQRRETGERPTVDATAGLVIAPLGLAVQQGATSGHLGWQEIRKVSVRDGRSTVTWSTATTPPGVVLEVEGASIVLTDSYDRPLSEIHDRILRYWR